MSNKSGGSSRKRESKMASSPRGGASSSRWETKKSHSLVPYRGKSISRSRSRSRSSVLTKSSSSSSYKSRSSERSHRLKKSPQLIDISTRKSLGDIRHQQVEKKRESHFKGAEKPNEITSNDLKRFKMTVNRNFRPIFNESQQIKRFISDPEKITIPRRPGEGEQPLFSRDEIVSAKRNKDSSESPPRESKKERHSSSYHRSRHRSRSDTRRSHDRYDRGKRSRDRSRSRRRSSDRSRRRSHSRSRRSRTRSRSSSRRHRSRSRPRALIEKRYPLKRRSRSWSPPRHYDRRRYGEYVGHPYMEMVAPMRLPYVHPMHLMPYPMHTRPLIHQPYWPMMPRMPVMRRAVPQPPNSSSSSSYVQPSPTTKQP